MKAQFGDSSAALAKSETWRRGSGINRTPEGVEPASELSCYLSPKASGRANDSRCYELVNDQVFWRGVAYVEPADTALKRFREVFEAYGAKPELTKLFGLAKVVPNGGCLAAFEAHRLGKLAEGNTVLKGLDDPRLKEFLKTSRLCVLGHKGTGDAIQSMLTLRPYQVNELTYKTNYAEWSSDPALRKRANESRAALEKYHDESANKELAGGSLELGPACLKMQQCIFAMVAATPAARAAYMKAWELVKKVAQGPGKAMVENICEQSVLGYGAAPNAPTACRAP